MEGQGYVNSGLETPVLGVRDYGQIFPLLATALPPTQHGSSHLLHHVIHMNQEVLMDLVLRQQDVLQDAPDGLQHGKILLLQSGLDTSVYSFIHYAGAIFSNFKDYATLQKPA